MAKRKVQLFIGNRPVDLSDNSLILYNYQMDDLTNPAAVKNSYSQQVTLPGTANNNLLFGEIFRLDTMRLDLYGDSYTGAGFAPWRRTPFVIYDEAGQIMENGYMRLDQVNRAGAKVSYTVSLFGGLGSFIYSLMYDDEGNKLSLADLDYLETNDTEHELDFTINATTVAEAWSCLGRTQVQSALKKWNVINFAPAYNGVPSDFDASKAVMKLTDGNYLASEDQNYKTKGGYTIVTLPKEYTEWDVKDLRSYHQRPVISMKAILSAIARGNNNGGYYVDLSAITSERFFPALDKMWVTCPMLSNETFKSDSLPDMIPIVDNSPSVPVLGSKVGDYALTLPPAMDEVEVNVKLENVRLHYHSSSMFDFVSGTLSSRSAAVHEGDNWNGVSIGLWAVGYNGAKSVALSSLHVFHNLKLWSSEEIILKTMAGGNLSNFSEIVTHSKSFKCSNKEAVSEVIEKLSLNGSNISRVTVRVKIVTFMEDNAGAISNVEVQTYNANNKIPVWNAANCGADYVFTDLGCQLSAKVSATYFTTSKTLSGRMVTKKRLLGFSGTPADYLLSFCKIFGLYLLCDRSEKRIKVCRRNDLYEDETLDLTKRVDLSQGISIRPLAVESKWYDFALPCVGGTFADGYKSKYGAEYGGQSADTGFGFNSDRFDVMSGNIFKSAASVLENSPYNNTLLWQQIMQGYTISNQIPSVFADGGSTYILWGTDADGQEQTLTKEIARPSASSSSFHYYNNKYRGYDYEGAAKLQLHDSGNKGVKGENVLVYYTGKVTYDGFGLSDDTVMMTELNNGVMCWELFYGRRSREIELPVFSGYLTDGAKIQQSLDFGRPDEIGVPGIVYPAGTTIYDKMWKQYFNDRYNVESQIKVMTCKVNLKGLDIGYGLLRKFYWFENSLWVMNKISNYSITTDDFVEVELVQVRNKDAYKYGQTVGLRISSVSAAVEHAELLDDSKSADVEI
ncbi:MAG: hypothetical protein K2J62_00495 [Bacteroidales bacterium]|nr:hypothetical protein [Bacteroidales bacterium]